MGEPAKQRATYEDLCAATAIATTMAEGAGAGVLHIEPAGAPRGEYTVRLEGTTPNVAGTGDTRALAVNRVPCRALDDGDLLRSR